MTTSEPAAAGRIQQRPADSQIDVYGLTHPGKVRRSNQDHFLVCSLRKQVHVHLTSLPDVSQLPLEGERLAYLAMVADGVGGGVGGGEASRLAIEAVVQYVTQSMRCCYNVDSTNEAAFLEALREAALTSHTGVLERASKDPGLHKMATTLTLWIGVWPVAYVLQVGDSRCYTYSDGELKQITRDQTLAQAMIDEGLMNKTEAEKSRLAHVLSSAIGGPQTLPSVTRVDYSWDHVGLLCSDGLTKHVDDERIAERLASMTSSRQAAEDLIQDALDGGGTDNITVIVGRLVRK